MANPTLDAAQAYARRGWAVIPITHRSKDPGSLLGKGWQHTRFYESDLPQHFNGQPRNIGVILGEPSGDLVDLDLDAPEAVAAAAWLAPDTAAVFGRPGKPRSHRLYISSGAPYRKFTDPIDQATILELRAGTGKQTIFPPSAHAETGEPITWHSEGEPFEVEAADLDRYARELAAAALLGKHWPGKGGRHDAARALAGGLWRGGLDEQRAADFVRAVVTAAGDTDESQDRERAVSDTYARGPQKSADGLAVYKITGWRALAGLIDLRVVRKAREWLGMTSPNVEEPPPPVADGTLTSAVPSPTFNTTDQGNGERLVARHGQDLRYCHLWGKWLVWDGRRWAVDDTAEVERRAKATIRAIYSEAAAVVGDDEASKAQRRALASWAGKSESRGKLEAMIKQAASEPGVAVAPDDLDRDPWLLNVQNGTLDLRTGQLRPHNRADLITKLCPVEYHADAGAPTWAAFLARIMDGNTDLVTFLQRAIGYSLTGSIRERFFVIAYGEGDNGKTTLLETIQALLGDYASRTPTETLMLRRDGNIPNDLARLKGARFVFASEVEQGRRLAVSLIKDMTGGDTITARFMRAEFFEFRPEFKIWLATNHKPRIPDTNQAIWRRIRLVPFAVSIPKAEQDKKLPEKLLAELPGILAWAVRGCLDWQRDGLDAPAEVEQATADYRAESDEMAAWLAECCFIGPKARAKSDDARKSYMDFTGYKVTSNEFAELLIKHGYKKDRSGGRTIWHGFALLTTPAPNQPPLVPPNVATPDDCSNLGNESGISSRNTTHEAFIPESLLQVATTAKVATNGAVPQCSECENAAARPTSRGWLCAECIEFHAGLGVEL